MPEVSIIVPVYNAEKYLDRCINSILAQTYRDFELILVDDGSSDGCPWICDKYAKIDNRVTVIHKENGGLCSARNLGIRQSCGKWIMFCDDDDSVSADWVETLHHFAIRHPDRLVSCEFAYVSQNGEKTVAHIQRYSETALLTKKEYFTLWVNNVSGSVWNRIFNSEIIRENNISFDETLNAGGEDAIFATDYLCCIPGGQMVYVPKCCYYWIDNDGNSASRKYNPRFFEIQRKTYWARKRLISEEDMALYINKQFYYMYHDGLGRAMKSEDKKLVRSILRDKAFRDALLHSDSKTASWKMKAVLLLGSYTITKKLLFNG